MSPTERSIAWLRGRGLPVGKLERWNAHARLRQDVFGFDLISVYDNKTLWIQTTTADHVSHRRTKLAALSTTEFLLQAGDLLWVHGWKDDDLQVHQAFLEKDKIVFRRIEPYLT